MGARACVIGFGVTGRTVTHHLVAKGWDVAVVEDNPAATTAADVEAAGARWATGLVPADLGRADLVVPSPGVAPDHPVVAAAVAAGVSVVSEIELAAAHMGSRRLIAITGTNGKTTVATLVAASLVEAGRSALAAGNIGLPLLDAVAEDVDVIVAEVSSFQLAFTSAFRAEVAVWLNLAEDHLDWHPSLDHYAAAKARIWANQAGDDVAVVNAEDEGVMSWAATAPAGLVTFGLEYGDFRVVEGVLRTSTGEEIVAVTDLARALPHDVANGLAASAAAMAGGADAAACGRALAGFPGLPHRVQLVGDSGGVRWYDDSKATTPASVLAALQGFESVVLIAGGRNKGLDLTVIGREAARLRAVVAIGEAAGDIAAAFAGRAVPVRISGSMTEAVSIAAGLAEPGDAVLLSPGCASFDWYTSYGQRGDHFAAAVAELIGS